MKKYIIYFQYHPNQISKSDFMKFFIPLIWNLFPSHFILDESCWIELAKIPLPRKSPFKIC